MVNWENYQEPTSEQLKIQKQFDDEGAKARAQKADLLMADIRQQHNPTLTNKQLHNIKVQYWCYLCESELEKTKGRITYFTQIEIKRMKCPTCDSKYEYNFSTGQFELIDGIGQAIKTTWGNM